MVNGKNGLRIKLIIEVYIRLKDTLFCSNYNLFSSHIIYVN